MLLSTFSRSSSIDDIQNILKKIDCTPTFGFIVKRQPMKVQFEPVDKMAVEMDNPQMDQHEDGIPQVLFPMNESFIHLQSATLDAQENNKSNIHCEIKLEAKEHQTEDKQVPVDQLTSDEISQRFTLINENTCDSIKKEDCFHESEQAKSEPKSHSIQGKEGKQGNAMPVEKDAQLDPCVTSLNPEATGIHVHADRNSPSSLSEPEIAIANESVNRVAQVATHIPNFISEKNSMEETVADEEKTSDVQKTLDGSMKTLPTCTSEAIAHLSPSNVKLNKYDTKIAHTVIPSSFLKYKASLESVSEEQEEELMDGIAYHIDNDRRWMPCLSLQTSEKEGISLERITLLKDAEGTRKIEHQQSYQEEIAIPLAARLPLEKQSSFTNVIERNKEEKDAKTFDIPTPQLARKKERENLDPEPKARKHEKWVAIHKFEAKMTRDYSPKASFRKKIALQPVLEEIEKEEEHKPTPCNTYDAKMISSPFSRSSCKKMTPMEKLEEENESDDEEEEGSMRRNLHLNTNGSGLQSPQQPMYVKHEDGSCSVTKPQNEKTMEKVARKEMLPTESVDLQLKESNKVSCSQENGEPSSTWCDKRERFISFHAIQDSKCMMFDNPRPPLVYPSFDSDRNFPIRPIYPLPKKRWTTKVSQSIKKLFLSCICRRS